jgi:proteasome lid subunit RPN8/RPN11
MPRLNLSLTADHLEFMRRHAQEIYPEECCGILLGEVGTGGKRLVDIQAVANDWSDAAAEALSESGSEFGDYSTRRRYSIAPRVMLQTMKAARDRNLQIIGIYHSHPDAPATPSECDRRLAWPDYSYVILSVPQGLATDICSWQLDEAQQFQPEPIEVMP